MSSGDFLAVHGREHRPGTGLPVVSLRFGDSDDLACPFVTDAGCRVYPARPASCRTYPLARGVSRSRKTGRLTEHWALIREPHCLGFQNGHPQTVDEWIDDQQIATHNRMNDMMLELISRKNRFRPGPLMPSEKKRYIRPCTTWTPFAMSGSKGSALGDRHGYRALIGNDRRSGPANCRHGLGQENLFTPFSGKSVTMKPNGKVALVLGGIKGIGKAIGLDLLAPGHPGGGHLA
jgi:Fe-S-cluster containining protein